MLMSVFDSLRHRNDALKASSALTDTIIGKILDTRLALLPSEQLTAIANEVLTAFDPIAGSVFQAQHQYRPEK